MTQGTLCWSNGRWVGLLYFGVFAIGCLPTDSATTEQFDDVLEGDVQGLRLRDAKVIDLGGDLRRVAVWETTHEGDGAAIALDTGRGFGPTRAIDYDIVLRDERVDAASSHKSGGVQPVVGSWQVVQFYAPTVESFLESVRSTGAAPIAPFHRNAWVVVGQRAELEKLRTLPVVRNVVALEARHRRPADFIGTARFDIVPASQSVELKSELHRQLESIGAEVHGGGSAGYLLNATLSSLQMREVESWKTVLHVDPWQAPESDGIDRARAMSGALVIENTLGYKGQGVRAEVMDGNVLIEHSDLRNRNILIHGPVSGDSSHGTPTTGIVFGDGTGNATARGILPEAQPIFASYEPLFATGSTVSRTALLRELVAPPYEAVFQSNSWGSGLTTQYTAISAELDAAIAETDLLVFHSQSNAGTRNSRPQAWSKNVVSIGGIKHLGTLDENDDKWDRGASIGPASDGRIKPELAHFWDKTTAPSSTGAYTEFGGTSGATPLTAGFAGLFLQMWSEGLFGNPVRAGAGVFANRPHFTLAKAFLINTATQWKFEGAGHDLGRVRQGWGRVDLKTIYELKDQVRVVNETDIVKTGDVSRYDVEVASGAPALKATLTWAEPPAVPSSGKHALIDLTLLLTSPSGVKYFGNVGLESGRWSTPGGSPDAVNTVENVFVERPESGKWVVEVRADAVGADNHLETAEMDADFALVVSGVQRNSVENIQPIIESVTPDEGAVVKSPVTVKVVASDADGQLKRVQFVLPDGTKIDDDAAPFELKLDSGLVGDVTVGVTAFDDRGGASIPVKRSMTMKPGGSNLPPTVTLAPKTGVLSGRVLFAATASDPDGRIQHVIFTWPNGKETLDALPPYRAYFDTALVADGKYVVRAVAVDGEGLASQPAVLNIEVKNSPAP